MKSFHEGLSSSNRYMAQSRRRDPLSATLAFPGCHTSIRRPALGAAGRGDLKAGLLDLTIMERNKHAKTVVLDIEAQRKQRHQ